jgi:hypothetical protein
MPSIIKVEVDADALTEFLNMSFNRVVKDFTKKGGRLDNMTEEALIRALRPMMREAVTNITEDMTGRAIANVDRAIKRLMKE